MSGFVPEDEVRVWCLSAVAPGPAWDLCFAVLSPKEQTRALRIRAGIARDEFVTGRAVLRGLLGEMLGLPPQQVEIHAGAKGKPFVDGGIRFNASHAHGTILLGFCLGGEIGVDLEWGNRQVEAVDIAEAYFAPAERARVKTARDQSQTFCEIWTRKEAVVKALGTGLGRPLDEFDVTAGDRVEIAGTLVFLAGLELGLQFSGCVASVGQQRQTALLHLEEAAWKTLLQKQG